MIDEEEKIKPTRSQIETMVDAVFPFRKSDGSPSYRSNQRQLCIDAVDAMTNGGYKVIVIDAPVGSGKSVINYVIGKLMGGAVYITSQKQLQDQIDKDGFPGVKVLKGKVAYTCNWAEHKGAAGTDCALRKHKDLPFKTCRSITGYQYDTETGGSIRNMRREVAKIHEQYRGADLKRHSSFANPEEMDNTFRNAFGEDEDKFMCSTACSMVPFECPVKSARVMANNADIAVLNPDVFYILRKMAGYFIDREVMIVDEAHRLDSAVQRMFKVELPVPMFEKLFDANLDSVVHATTSQAAADAMLDILNKRVLPIIALAGIWEDDTINEHHDQTAIVNSAMNNINCGGDDPSALGVRDKFFTQCRGLGIDEKLVDIRELLPDVPVKDMVKYVVDAKEMAGSACVLMKMMLSLSYKDKYKVFVKDVREVKGAFAIGGYSQIAEYEDSDRDMTVLSFTPIHIGAILQMLFFSGMKSIVLSSGTWPDAMDMLRDYGFSGQKIKKLNAQPTFPPKSRPIYICNNINYTDFSEKGVDGRYLYQTRAGARKFCSEIDAIMQSIRRRLGAKTNIAIHTFSHNITALFAEHCVNVDKMLIHLQRRVVSAIPENGVFEAYDKDYLIDTFCSNPDAGYTLVSPSIVEGLDFKYGICRAQIIVKAPIPNLGDAYISNRFKGNPDLGLAANRNFLDRVCAIDLNQTYGRVMRADDDYGETFIMDMSLAKRLANAFNVGIDGFDGRAPGSMGSMNLDYIKQGVRISSDGYKARFQWPVM